MEQIQTHISLESTSVHSACLTTPEEAIGKEVINIGLKNLEDMDTITVATRLLGAVSNTIVEGRNIDLAREEVRTRETVSHVTTLLDKVPAIWCIRRHKLKTNCGWETWTLCGMKTQS